jgi:hypothetical protein
LHFLPCRRTVASDFDTCQLGLLAKLIFCAAPRDHPAHLDSPARTGRAMSNHHPPSSALPPLFFLLRPSSTPPTGTAIPASQQQSPLLLRPSTHIPYGLRPWGVPSFQLSSEPSHIPCGLRGRGEGCTLLRLSAGSYACFFVAMATPQPLYRRLP